MPPKLAPESDLERNCGSLKNVLSREADQYGGMRRTQMCCFFFFPSHANEYKQPEPVDENKL